MTDSGPQRPITLAPGSRDTETLAAARGRLAQLIGRLIARHWLRTQGDHERLGNNMQESDREADGP